MPTHPYFRLGAILGFVLCLGLAVVCVSVAIGARRNPDHVVRATYRFDVGESEAPAATLEAARAVLEARLAARGIDERSTRTESPDLVQLEFRPPARGDATHANHANDALGPDLEALLGSRGDLRVLAQADASSVAALHGDLEHEKAKLARWRISNPGARVDAYDELPFENGGPTRGLCWYPLRARTRTSAETPDCLPFLVPPAKWSFHANDLARVRSATDDAGVPIVQFEIHAAREVAFGDFTASLIGRPLAFVVSGEVVTLATVRSRLSGSGVLAGGSGGFDAAEADRLAIVLAAGELPARPVLVSATRAPRENLTPFGAALIGVSALTGAVLCAATFVLSARAARRDRAVGR